MQASPLRTAWLRDPALSLFCGTHTACISMVWEEQHGLLILISVRPPFWSKIFSISCSFSEILANSYVGASPWVVGTPSYGKSWIRPWLRLATIRIFMCYITLITTDTISKRWDLAHKKWIFQVQKVYYKKRSVKRRWDFGCVVGTLNWP